MKIQFISNSGCLVYLNTGRKILIDPWITEGIYIGSWIHSPPLKMDYLNLQLRDDDFLYISHVHSDHLDVKFLEKINKNLKVILHNHQGNFVKKCLSKIGFKRFIEIDSKCSKTLDNENLKITMFGPFTKHPFQNDTKIGNIIDSSCLFECDGFSFFHVNDNKLNINAVKKFNLEGLNPDALLINYNPAGPYPSCFENIDIIRKLEIANNVGKRCLENTIDVLKLIKPKIVIPISGNYKINKKIDIDGTINKSLGHISIKEASKMINSVGLDSIIFEESQILNFEDFSISYDDKLKPYSQKYIPNSVNYLNKKNPDIEELLCDLKKAISAMKHRWQKYGGTDIKTRITLQIDEKNKITLWEGEASYCDLKISMDKRLLNEIINRKAFFDDAQIGCHIKFKRLPDIYEYDAMTMLQFLHL